MKYSKFFIVLIFIFKSVLINAQAIDSNAINLVCKLKVFLEIQNEIKGFNAETFNKYLESDIKVKYLNSNIDWMLFIEVNISFSSLSNYVPINECNRFIVAINKSRNESFGILNFERNDIKEFLKLFKEEGFVYQLFPKRIYKDYYIEGIDLECLIKGSKKGKIDTNKYPCFHFCGEPIKIY